MVTWSERTRQLSFPLYTWMHPETAETVPVTYDDEVSFVGPLWYSFELYYGENYLGIIHNVLPDGGYFVTVDGVTSGRYCERLTEAVEALQEKFWNRLADLPQPL